MGQPVVHFEIIGKDPDRLRSYYSRLFGWEFERPSPVASEVSEPESYGFLARAEEFKHIPLTPSCLDTSS